MINIPFTESIILTVITLTVYLFTISVNGYLQALIINAMGDSTPEDAGFLSLNPMVHFDLLGFIFVMLKGFGWGKFIPLNPTYIRGKGRMAKIIFLYSLETLISLVIAYGAMLIGLLVFGGLFDTLYGVFSIHSGSLIEIFAHFKDFSSLHIILALFLATLVVANIFLATLGLIYNTFRFIIFLGFEKNYAYSQYSEFLAFFGPLAAMLLLDVTYLDAFFWIVVRCCVLLTASLFSLL